MILFWVHKHEQDVHKLLPYGLILIIDSALDFNDQVAYLMDHTFFWDRAQSFQKLCLYYILGITAKSLPEISIVCLIGDVLRISCSVRNVSS